MRILLVFSVSTSNPIFIHWIALHTTRTSTGELLVHHQKGWSVKHLPNLTDFHRGVHLGKTSIFMVVHLCFYPYRTIMDSGPIGYGLWYFGSRFTRNRSGGRATNTVRFAALINNTSSVNTHVMPNILPGQIADGSPRALGVQTGT